MWALFPKSDVLLRHKTLCCLCLYLLPDYYKRHQVLTVSMKSIHILGIISIEFASNDSYWRKNNSSNSALWRYFLFRCSQKFIQSFLVSTFCNIFNTLPDNFQLHLLILTFIFILSFFSITIIKTSQIWTWKQLILL